MFRLFQLFVFTLFYFQLDSILKPCVYDRFEIFQQEPIAFYPVIQSVNIFTLSIFSIFTTHLVFFSKIKNYTIFSLAFIYIKYVIDTILYNNVIGIYQYEFRRTLMWLFTTPLMLKLYCDMNQLTLKDVYAQYHIGSNALYILLFPFRRTGFNSCIILVLSIAEGCFIYKLLRFKQQKYTKFIIYIWTLFSFVTLLDAFKLFSLDEFGPLFDGFFEFFNG
jgi:hypothetical protein